MRVPLQQEGMLQPNGNSSSLFLPRLDVVMLDSTVVGDFRTFQMTAKFEAPLNHQSLVAYDESS